MYLSIYVNVAYFVQWIIIQDLGSTCAQCYWGISAPSPFQLSVYIENQEFIMISTILIYHHEVHFRVFFFPCLCCLERNLTQI